MFILQKTFEIAASHALTLDYGSPCQRVHGHNWKITVWCQTEELNSNGMVIDFAEIKGRVHAKLDHQNLNDVLDCNPTAENLAYWIFTQLPQCVKVTVQESEHNIATYEAS